MSRPDHVKGRHVHHFGAWLRPPPPLPLIESGSSPAATGSICRRPPACSRSRVAGDQQSKMHGMRMAEIVQILDREDRCVRVALLIFAVIQMLLLSALLLPEDPVILEIQPLPGSAKKVHPALTTADPAPQNVKYANHIFPTDGIATNSTLSTTENEDRVAAEPTNTSNITIGEEVYDLAGAVINSRVSQEVLPKQYDQPAASGVGKSPSDMATTINSTEEYEFVPFPGSTRAAKQTQPPNNAISRFDEKATTANKEKSITSAARFGQGWKDTIAGRFFRYDVAGAKVNRPQPSAANDLGQREALPAMNGLALLPLLDRLYWATQRGRVRTAHVASAAATAAVLQALALACPVLLLLKAKYWG
ncbi:Protein of unknown function [Gryllus bimaculatus]|nr:Protein of unknown function [Gryllus bimaculatus]